MAMKEKVKEKIMVVDDEPSIRKYLRTLLEVDGSRSRLCPAARKPCSGSAKASAPTSSFSTC